MVSTLSASQLKKYDVNALSLRTTVIEATRVATFALPTLEGVACTSLAAYVSRSGVASASTVSAGSAALSVVRESARGSTIAFAWKYLKEK
jgi:hypothetical protein